MDNLSDVCSCLRGLDSSKATDRKKNALRLQELLDTSSVKRVLDKNTDDQTLERVVTWDAVLRGANKFISIELASLKTAKESQSASTLANRGKRKNELASLFKFVVRAANSRGPKLCASLLIESVLEVFNDDYSLEALGEDYSSLLLKSVLRVRAYWLKLTPSQWRKLLHIYCKLFEEEAFDRDVVVRIIHELVTGNIQQGELNPKKLFKFFSHVMEHISDLRSPPMLENLLMALNSFCDSAAYACRAQLCGFGENHMGAFTSLWEKASTEKIKDELIVFLHLLVRAHHPHGVSEQDRGAFAIDWELWQSQLLLLHELLMSYIDIQAGSYRIISGSKDSGLKPSYISFAADIFRQLPVAKIVPVSPDWSLTQFTQFTTQFGEGHASSSGAATPAKRQRLAPENKALLQILRESSGTLQAVPWLQLLRQILERYPEKLDDESLNITLEILVYMLSRCKKGDLYQHLFAALSALTSALHQHGIHGQQQAQLMSTLWSHCLSTINSRQAGVEGYQDQGFTTMACIVHSGYVQPRPEIWNLFLPGLCQPCSAAECLLTALICQGIPENHVPSIVGASVSDWADGTQLSRSKPSHPLRKYLIRWLLPFHDPLNGSAEGSKQMGLDPHRVADLLFALTLQDLTLVLRKTHKWATSDCRPQSPYTLECMYLDSSFEIQDYARRNVKGIFASDLPSSKILFNCGPNIPSVLEYLAKHLFQIKKAMDSLEPGIQTLKYKSWLSCVLANLTYLLRSQCSITETGPDTETTGCANINKAKLHTSSLDAVDKVLSSVVEKCAASFVAHVKQHGWTGLRPVLGYLCSMLEWERDGDLVTSEVAMIHMAQVVHSALPASFVDLLIDILSGKAVRTEIKKSKGRYDAGRLMSRTSDPGNSSRPADDLDFDMFDESLSHHTRDNRQNSDDDGDDIDGDMDLGISLGCESGADLKNNKNFLCDTSLTEVQHIQLGSLQLLIRLISFDQQQVCEPIVRAQPPTAGIHLDYVKSEILHRVSIDSFDPACPLDVHMLLTILEQLLRYNHTVTDGDLKALLRAVRQTAKEQQKDQQVCCRLVESLRFIVPHLKGQQQNGQSDPPPSEGIVLCRDFFYKIASSFWLLACDGTPPLKLKMAELLLDLIKFDPDCSWGQLRVERNNGAGNDDRDSPGFSLCTVNHQFPRLLLESSLIVKAFVARSLNWLFLGKGARLQRDKKAQIKIFDETFLLCSELLSTERDTSLNIKDELANGQSIFLQVLLTIIKCSPVCEKPCLLGLFQMVSDKEISPQLVRKMLRQAGTHLGYADVEEYLASHLPYLVHNWLHEDMVGSPLEEFPYHLLGYTDAAQFTRSYPNLVVSMLLATKLDIGQVRAALTTAQLDMHTALLSALPDILVHILPPFAARAGRERQASEAGGTISSSQQFLVRQYQAANKCFAVLKKSLSEQEINERVCEILGVIVVKVLSCLQVKGQSMVYPEPNPPYYDEDKIVLTLDYLAQNFNDDSGAGEFSLIGVLAKVPNGLHQVFLSLSSQLWKEHHPHEQNRCMLMMAIFVRLVLNELRPGGRSRETSAVIVRDILNRMLVILLGRSASDKVVTMKSPSYEEDVILSCLDILHDVCQSVLTNCPQELVPFLHRLVDAVSNVAAVSEAIGESALQILHTLTAPGQQSAVKLLNPLPHVPVLAQLRAELEGRQRGQTKDLLQHFEDCLTECKTTSNFPSRGLALRLENLCELIVSNNSELHALACSDTGLSRLRTVVQRLSSLITSKCQAVATAAASCLGAIGPINLQVFSIARGTSDSMLEAYKGHEYEKYCWSFHALDSSLLDESLEVVGIASRILQRVMATESCRQFERHFTKSQNSLFRYLRPFKNCVSDMPDPEPSLAFPTVDRTDLWLGESSPTTQTHDTWVKTLVAALLSTNAVNDEVMRNIGALCAVKVDVSEACLPYLIHDILKGAWTECRDILSKQFTAFFHTHCLQLKSSKQAPVKYPIVMNKSSLRTMLSVIQFLRTQKRPPLCRGEQHTPWHNNLWLELDYLEVARAAEYCGASFSAVLFTEIYCGIKRQALENGNGTGNGSQKQGLQSNFLTVEMLHECQGLLMESYKNIGDPDGIYGCGAGKQADFKTRVDTYLHELQPEKALTTLDIAMCNNPSMSLTPLLQVLQSCGTEYLLGECLPRIQGRTETSSTSPGSLQTSGVFPDQLDELQYQAAWKLGQWDLCLPHRQCSAAPFHESLYRCLASIRDGHLDVARTSLQAARMNAVLSYDSKVETCSHLYPFLSQLQCLGYLDLTLKQLQTPDSSINVDHAKPVSCQLMEFRFQESLLQLMSSTSRTLTSCDFRQGEAMEVKSMWSLAMGGRKAKHFQVAERAVQTLKLKLNTHDKHLGLTQQQLQLEEAKLFWARSEVDIAKNILLDLLHSQSQMSSQKADAAIYLQGLVLYGNWLAETKSETPTVIIKDFLQKAVDMLHSSSENSIPGKTALQAFVSLASFADKQYQLLADYMQSPVYEEKVRLLGQSLSELEEYRKLNIQNRTTQITQKSFNIDKMEIAALEKDRACFLHQALDSYLQCLRRGSLYDLCISRVVALWFVNSTTKTINEMLETHVPMIQSHKFLLLFYQLAARMGTEANTDDGGFQTTLMKLMERVATEHPHHALWVVLALAHAHRDKEFTAGNKDQTRKGRRNSAGEAVIEEERVQAAKDLLERVSRAESGRAGMSLDKIVNSMRKFSLACIELANQSVDKQASTQTIPHSLAIAKLQDLENIQVPIVELAIDPTGSYTNLVSVGKFDRSFTLAGGVNLPKIVGCIGSDGIKRKMLIKGRDDLRQDAVMQQVFSLVNQLLSADQDARQRQLNIRTYKVVPLSQNSGLLQWCDGTMPLWGYLAGQGDAHSRYNPHDWTVNECRKKMQLAAPQVGKQDKRFEIYQNVCANLHPVFRHFFLERFVEPDHWFERKLAYTRSVATNSIVGYFLGLGDRHVNNILIDLTTAELVHIDFGIAFEQGRILPTPETVPFRLTRDIVDGMGIPGVEGVFRRCCEKMVQVMKNNSEALLTIVEVLLHDPLSHWSLSPSEARALQRRREQAAPDTADVTLSGQVVSSGQTGQINDAVPNETKEKRNKVAERTLMRLRQKLSGEEDGIPLSVSGQVNLLIQKATDPKNLSRLFHGWQAYL